ncbi:MAG TPA: hypothetical protein PLG52_06875, partial [Anaerolineales bacterium]|nr:hypothetical protein [Anaerolineales bacterium]
FHPPVAVRRVDEGRRRRKMKKNYARLCLCKNSRRLREASIVKTVNKERNKKRAKYVSMPVSYNSHLILDLRTS